MILFQGSLNNLRDLLWKRLQIVSLLRKKRGIFQLIKHYEWKYRKPKEHKEKKNINLKMHMDCRNLDNMLFLLSCRYQFDLEMISSNPFK